jgi:hypothetical protein
MESDELRRLLQEWRDSNRQLAESQRQIADSLQRIERMWAGQVQMLGGGRMWLPMLAPLLMFIPVFAMMWRR